MQTVLIIVTSFILVGLVIYYLRNQEFKDNLDAEAKKAKDAIKSKLQK